MVKEVANSTARYMNGKPPMITCFVVVVVVVVVVVKQVSAAHTEGACAQKW